MHVRFVKAFYKCAGFKSITIPASVKMIGSEAFRGSGLDSLNFKDNSKDMSLLVEIGKLVSIFYLYSNIPNYEQYMFVM